MKWFFVVLYSATIFATPNGKRFGSEETESTTTKAVTSEQIAERTINGRMILYVHQVPAIRNRQNILGWVKQFNYEKQYKDSDAILFSSHLYRNSVDFVNETGVTEFPNLIYFIGNQFDVFNSDTTNNASVLEWLGNLDSKVLRNSTTYEELNNVLSSTKNCSNKYLIVGDESQCPLGTISNIARVLKKYEIQIVQMRLPLEINSHVVLYKRLGYLSENSCQIAVLLHANSYSVFEDDISPKAIEVWLNERLPSMKSHCTDLMSKENYQTTHSEDYWSDIKDELTELEQIYFISEKKSEQQNRRVEFILVGLTGGLAVMILAYSIFWGLNGSAFAK